MGTGILANYSYRCELGMNPVFCACPNTFAVVSRWRPDRRKLVRSCVCVGLAGALSLGPARGEGQSREVLCRLIGARRSRRLKDLDGEWTTHASAQRFSRL